MNREQKDYIGKRFEVEATKLTKLVKVMHEKLGVLGDISDSFIVFMVGNHRAELHSLDQVLSLDNSAKHRIVRLKAQSSSRLPGETLSHAEIDVDFGATFKTSNGSQTGVTVEAAGPTAGWVADTISEVEQQVERSWVQHTPPMLFILLIIIGSFLSIVLSHGTSADSMQAARDFATMMWLTREDLSAYAETISARGILTEEEQRKVLSKQVANLASFVKQYDETRRDSLKSLGKSLLAVAAIAGVGVVLLVRCYPAAVFLWGDERGRQETRDRMKRLLWPLLLAISFVPVFVQLFLPAIISSFK